MALFGRRQPNDVPAKQGGESEPPRENAQPRAYPRPDMVTAPQRPSAPLSATPVATAHMAAHPSAAPSHPSAPALHPTAHIADPSRRSESIAAPTPPRRNEEPRREERAPSELDGKKLIVGKQIVLSGEIKACEKLVVEGKVEASLTDSHSIEILKDGLFKGAATIDVADISGRFEGDLIVRQRLMVRATGHIVGSVRYGEMEIERGGVIAGDMRPLAEGDSSFRSPDPMPGYNAGSGGADDGAPDR